MSADVLKAVVSGLSLLAALSSCSSAGPADGDALDLGSNEFTVCVPSAHTVNTVGNVIVRNVSDASVTIEEIALVEPRALELIHAELAPRDGVQVDGTWPPTLIDPRPRSEPAVGATLAAGDERALWLGVQGTDERGTGTAKNFVVSYTIGDRSFTQKGAIGIAVTDHDCGNPPTP